MPPSKLRPPVTRYEEASALIRESLPPAREAFTHGVLVAEPSLSADQLRVIASYAGDYAARMVEVCCSPEMRAILRHAIELEDGDEGDDVA